MNDTKISAYASFIEVTRSDTAKRKGIVNIPGETQIEALRLVCTNVFDKVREHFNKPIYISSGYRCQELDKAVGGQLNSQHLRGEAIDIDADIFGGVTNKEIFDYIKENLEFDQLLWEGGPLGWVHVSLKPFNNRKSVGTIPNP